MNSCVNIWQSPFMKHFTVQQHHRWFRSRAGSSVLLNTFFLIFVASERHFQTVNWLFPSLVKYSAYHSQICLSIVALLTWNILDFGFRYLHCCYVLSRKFVAASEEEKLTLSRSINGSSSLIAVKRLSSPSSPQKASLTPPSLPSSSSPLLNSVYLPSATPTSARLQHQQLSRQLSGCGALTQQQQSHVLSNSVRYSSDEYRGCGRHQAAVASASFGGSSGASGDLSAYFSPPRNLSALSASLILGSGGSHHASLQHANQPQQHSPHLDDFSYLSRLRYQLGTPSPSRQRARGPGSAYPAESILSLMSPPDAEPARNQQEQQLQANQRQSQCSRVSPDQTVRLLGIDRELACTPRGLDRWLQAIRAWLHGTLVEPLSRDVSQANARLREAGASPEMLIGQASLAQLQAAAASASTAPWTRTLAQLLPYLQACEDQGYLVQRLAELASLPCLGAYRWDSGSPDRWIADRHPPDARLLMLLLSAYLDRVLPPLPGSQRPFSSVFLASGYSASAASSAEHQPRQQQLLTASPTVAGQADSQASGAPTASASSSASSAASAGVELRIIPAAKQPPHYQLLLLSQLQQQQFTVLDVAPGSRNLFYTLLFFFYFYHSQRGGRLRQVSLGESGLNLDWIFSRSGGGNASGAALDIEDLLCSPTQGKVVGK